MSKQYIFSSNTILGLKTEKDILGFAQLQYKHCSFDQLQAYYSDLFDLFENPPCELSQDTDEKLQRKRWEVEEFCHKNMGYLDRDSLYHCTFSDGKIADLLITG
jgi:hypothetical protein